MTLYIEARCRDRDQQEIFYGACCRLELGRDNRLFSR